MAKENLARVVRRCSGVSGKHQMMDHRTVTSCQDDLVRECCWRDALGVWSIRPSLSPGKFIRGIVVVMCPVGAAIQWHVSVHQGCVKLVHKLFVSGWSRNRLEISQLLHQQRSCRVLVLRQGASVS
jgi:hypothetical protein